MNESKETKAVEIEPEDIPQEELGLDENEEALPEYTDDQVPPEKEEAELPPEMKASSNDDSKTIYPLTEDEAFKPACQKKKRPSRKKKLKKEEPAAEPEPEEKSFSPGRQPVITGS